VRSVEIIKDSGTIIEGALLSSGRITGARVWSGVPVVPVVGASPVVPVVST
jgi:hypothetical protein